MNNPKVSVIIPNYNHAKYLEKRIQSVLDQTFQDFEILYLDDASTDGSAAVFARFESNPRIRSILNAKNSGTPFIQWNRGVREARGEYIWIAEADDYADPRFLETLVTRLDENPRAGLAYCVSRMVDQNDVWLGLLPVDKYADPNIPAPQIREDKALLKPLQDWHSKPWAHDFIADGPLFYRHFMIYDNEVPNASAVVFRKAVYDAAGGGRADMRLCGDHLTWIGLLKVADVIYIAQPLNYFRAHAGTVRSTSNKAGAAAVERYQVAEEILADLPLDAKEIDHLCHLRLGNWLQDFLSPTRRVPWQRSAKILQMARRNDPHLTPRLLKQTAFYLMHRLPLFEMARDAAFRVKAGRNSR